MTPTVLDNVRSALGRSAGQDTPPRPPVLSPRQGGLQAEEIDLLLSEVSKLSGNSARLTPAEIPGALAELVKEYKIQRAALWSSPRLLQLEIANQLRSLSVEILPPDADASDLANCDLGITEADFVLPETGTLVLLASPEKPRSVSLLPHNHLAIVSPQALRQDLHQVFAEAKSSAYLVFITGPSRTADIELTVTLGVHGPKHLAVWVV